MLSLEEALEKIAFHVRPKAALELPLAEALGLALDRDATSDVDIPPHDKALMDGYAVMAADLEGGLKELEIVEEVFAGMVPSRTLSSGQATRIMTGAPLPPRADAVVMVEHTELVPADSGSLGRVRIVGPAPKRGANLMLHGAALRRGQTAVRAGSTLRPVEIGMLAETGLARVPVVPSPVVAILSTGNELVDAEQIPAPGQIRNSNEPLLAAAVRRAGATPINLGISRDTVDDLRRAIERGLASDVLVLSGGVSAGVLDLVPSVLKDLNVREVFHKVRIKPGKPVWFGLHGEGNDQRLVFGLPGNPVSSFVCFEVFVRPALDRLAGRAGRSRPILTVSLGADFSHRGDRPTFYPVQLDCSAQPPRAFPLSWQGSSDLRTLVEADALVHFPAGDREHSAGDLLEAIEI